MKKDEMKERTNRQDDRRKNWERNKSVESFKRKENDKESIWEIKREGKVVKR